MLLVILLLLFSSSSFSTVSYLAVNEFTNEIAQFESGNYGPPLFWKTIPSGNDSIWEIWINSDTHMYGYKKATNPILFAEGIIVLIILLMVIIGCSLYYKWLIKRRKKSDDVMFTY